MSGSAALAITASFVWGILSILLSPCHLSGIPLVVAYVTDRTTDVRKSLLYSSLFGLGNIVTVGVIGALNGYSRLIAGDPH
jgi:cytochrome c-type biogenesis protein